MPVKKVIRRTPWPSFRRHPVYASFIVLVLAGLTVFIAGQGVLSVQKVIDFNKPAAQQVTVQGEGSVTIAPDTATVSLGVLTRGESVASVQEANTNTMNTLNQRIKELGVPQENLRTINYNVYEDRAWNPETGEYEPRGWVVSQTLRVKIKDLKKAPVVIQIAGEAGVTNVHGLQFTTEEIDDLRQQARDEAIKNAKAQAQAIADALGVKLDGVVNYTENAPSGPGPVFAETLDSARGGAVPEIEPGTEELTLNVSVTYQLR